MKLYQKSKMRLDIDTLKLNSMFDTDQYQWLIYSVECTSWGSGSGHAVALHNDVSLWYFDLSWNSWGRDIPGRKITLEEYKNNIDVTDMDFKQKVYDKAVKLLCNP